MKTAQPWDPQTALPFWKNQCFLSTLAGVPVLNRNISIPCFLRGIRKMVGCLKAVRPVGLTHIPIDTPGFQIRSRAQYHGLCVIHCAGKCLFTPLILPSSAKISRHFRLTYGEMICVFQGPSLHACCNPAYQPEPAGNEQPVPWIH